MQQRSASRWSAGARPGTFGRVARAGVAVALVAVPSAAVVGLVWLSGIGLRDQRYFDGWVLAAGIGIQLLFHITARMRSLSPRGAARWRKVHINVGYVTIVAFASHLGASLPDMPLEWALAMSFVIVSASGVAGTYLNWSLRTRQSIDPTLTRDLIAVRRADLARAVEATVMRSGPVAPTILPAPAYDSWIADLYTTRLRDAFAAPCSATAHLLGSRRLLDRLTGEIDELARYLDEPGKAKLAEIRALVVERNRLDAAAVQIGLGEAWLLIHVPLTYALIVLAALHIAVVYAFTARPW